MCGLCGIVDYATGSVSSARLAAMNDALMHRGPDGGGLFRDGPVGLGHRRLSIIDLSETGAQPMVSACGRWVLAYNGELYNYRDLKAELIAAGVAFQSTSDTEVLLQALIRWGDDALPRLNGMFALALWDRRERTLLLARDRFGIKPLYWVESRGGITFGSEIKALCAGGAVTGELSSQALSEYLWYGNPIGEETIFDGVRQLAPSHAMRLTPDGRREAWCYWDIHDVTPSRDDFETAKARVRELLDAAVERHMLADVPVAAFLSGGIDSSAIVAYAARRASGRLRTFSAGFDFDGVVNELDRARAFAAQYDTDHAEVHVAGGDMRAVLEALVAAHDQPFADPANIPLLLMSRELQSAGVKAVLQGDGGDEFFAGYSRYVLMANEGPLRLLGGGMVLAKKMGLGRFVSPRADTILGPFQASDAGSRMGLLLSEEKLGVPPERILHEDVRHWLQDRDPFARYRDLAARCAGLNPAHRMLVTDCRIEMPQTFLEKVDKSTMAASVEARVPFLDTALADYVLSLPARYKVRRGKKKHLLREAMRGIVPDTVLDGRKEGFAVPHGHWLRTSLAGYMREVLFDPTVTALGMFDRATLERTVEAHIDGAADHGTLLWKALNLALWTVQVRAPLLNATAYRRQTG